MIESGGIAKSRQRAE